MSSVNLKDEYRQIYDDDFEEDDFDDEEDYSESARHNPYEEWFC